MSSNDINVAKDLTAELDAVKKISSDALKVITDFHNGLEVIADLLMENNDLREQLSKQIRQTELANIEIKQLHGRYRKFMD